jgi:hypothetical protein
LRIALNTMMGDPQAIDRLVEALPVDLEAIDRVLGSYLDEIDDLGGTMSDLLAGDGIAPWLMGIAAVSAGCLTVRRLRRRSRNAPLSVAASEDSTSWLLDMTWAEA